MPVAQDREWLMNCFLKDGMADLVSFPPLPGLATQALFSYHTSLFPLVGLL